MVVRIVYSFILFMSATGLSEQAFAWPLRVDISGPSTVEEDDSAQFSARVSDAVGSVDLDWSVSSRTTRASAIRDTLYLGPVSGEEEEITITVTARDSKYNYASDTTRVRVRKPWYWSTLVYDYEYYIKTNKDLAHLSRDQAKRHWKEYGMFQGLIAHPLFSAKEYAELYPKVASYYGGHLGYITKHYAEFAARAGEVGRIILSNKVYSDSEYKAMNPSLANLTSEQLRTHWVTKGIKSNLSARFRFKALEYYELNPEIRGKTGKNYVKLTEHYVREGYADKRMGSIVFHPGVFDVKYYRSKHKTLKSDSAARNHWVLKGIAAGSQGDPKFNVKKYVAKYANVRKAYGKDYRRAMLYYVTRGIPAGHTSQ